MATRKLGVKSKRPKLPISRKTLPIIYPPGCEEVQKDMNVDVLVKRLKVLAQVFQNMTQERKENAYDELIPLFMYVAEDGFLHHNNKEVRSLIACVIGDVLRICAPYAPYKEPSIIKAIFKFLIGQLNGLTDPMDPLYKRYVCLLENLVFVKTFNMCFELDNTEAKETIFSLLELIFRVVCFKLSANVNKLLLDLIWPIMSDCNSSTLSSEMLNLIFINIMEPIKTDKKNAYNMAKELILKCSSVFEPEIQSAFHQILILGREDENLYLSQNAYDVIYELNLINPSVISGVIPKLEYNLRSIEESERLNSVSLLARMFSEKGSNLVQSHQFLWQTFLGRFNDISLSVRLKCVQYSPNFLVNHEELRTDIIEALKMRQYDTEENVRLEVVKAIVETAKADFTFVAESEVLLNYMKERALDRKFKIRNEALHGLGLIYKTHLSSGFIRETTNQTMTWIKEKILHVYYMNSLDDRFLVEKLLNTCLVPYQLEAQERMMKLLLFFGNLDDNATKAFIEIQKNLLLVRRQMSGLLKCIQEMQSKPEMELRLNLKILELVKYMPDQMKATEFLSKFCGDLSENPDLMRKMEIILNQDTDCKTVAETTNLVLKKLGNPVKTNKYFNVIKPLLERTASLLIDQEAITKLVNIIDEVVKDNTEIIGSLSLERSVIIDRGLHLVNVLAFAFPSCFTNVETLRVLITFITFSSPEQQSIILTSLTNVGEINQIGQQQSLLPDLVPLCESMVLNGTPKQVKAAVRCLFTNMNDPQRKNKFFQIVNRLSKKLDQRKSSFRSNIVAIGHIAILMSEEFCAHLKPIISQKIIKELLMNPTRTDECLNQKTDPWCEEIELPEITQCMLACLKSTYRWLVGFKNNYSSAEKIFKMLTAFIETGGAFINCSIPFSNAEKSWLRLTAGCCMLKICEEKGVGDQFTAIQFCMLSKLMMDEVVQVRSIFARKLHRGLARGIPNKCLPTDFLGLYSLAGYETNKELKSTIRNYMYNDVSRRREYIKSLLVAAFEKSSEQLPHIMPDYMLAYSVVVLAHNPKYKTHMDLQELSGIKECLWFILEPLILKNDSYSFGFYKRLIEKMKNHNNTIEPNCDDSNNKMYAICDIALGLILQRSPNFELRGCISEPRIPSLYFKRHENRNYVNVSTYIPNDMQFGTPKKPANTLPNTSQSQSQTEKTSKDTTASRALREHDNGNAGNTPEDQPNEVIKVKVRPAQTKGESKGKVVKKRQPRATVPTKIQVFKPKRIVRKKNKPHPDVEQVSQGEEDVSPLISDDLITGLDDKKRQRLLKKLDLAEDGSDETNMDYISSPSDEVQSPKSPVPLPPTRKKRNLNVQTRKLKAIHSILAPPTDFTDNPEPVHPKSKLKIKTLKIDSLASPKRKITEVDCDEYLAPRGVRSLRRGFGVPKKLTINVELLPKSAKRRK